MTMDAVADRAGAGKATVYRRWPSKVQLTVDAVVCGPGCPCRSTTSPTPGRCAATCSPSASAGRRSDDAELMSGLMSAVRENPELAAVFHEQFVALTRRADARICSSARRRAASCAPDVDLDMVAAVAPAMISYRKMVAGQHVDDEFVMRMIDSVILPLATGA